MEGGEVADFSAFLTELQSETDRAAALVGAALIDHHLRETLRTFMVAGNQGDSLLDGAHAPLGTLSARVKACYALGLITEYEQGECDVIRAIRNKFAHEKHGLTFNDAKIQKFCDRLQAPIATEHKDLVDTPRKKFNVATALIVAHLHLRPRWIHQFKRTVLQDDVFPSFYPQALDKSFGVR